MRGWIKGRARTVETRAKISDSLRGRSRPDLSTSLRGHPVSLETRIKIGAAQRGRPRPHQGHPQTAETRAKISANNGSHRPEIRHKIGLATARNLATGVYRRHRGPTNLELALRRLLQTAGFDFQEQIQFGRCVVDAWIPSHRLVFEADGYPWHAMQERNRPGWHAQRDTYLMNHGVIAVIHLTHDDLAPFDISDP